MKVNVYLCVLDLVIGDYWMRCVMFGKEVTHLLHITGCYSQRILFYYSFNRYVILFVTSGILFIYLYSLFLASVFIAVTTVLLIIVLLLLPFFVYF